MKKHVLILCLLGNPYQHVEGGFHRTVYEIIEHFKETDIDITLISSNATLSTDRFQQKYSNIRFWELALDSTWVNNQDNLFLNANFLIQKIHRIILDCKKPFSLIHSLQWINGYLATEINLQYKIPHIHSIISSSYERAASGFSLRSQYQRMCEDCIFKKADLLISITPSERKQLIEHYHVPSSKILIVGRSVDIYYSYFHNVRHTLSSKEDKMNFNTIRETNIFQENQKAFVYVGRIIEYKGIREIVKAWEVLYKKYKAQMPPLWIIGGKDKDIAKFRYSLIKENPSFVQYEQEHKLYWWGFMESYGISTILQKTHALLMHSAFEPGGRVVLEAMSSNKPVIATPTGFAESYIKDWYNGFKVEYQDINRLTNCMEFFVKNDYLSNMLGLNAKKTYNILSKKWDYYERLNSLYHLNQINVEDFSGEEEKFENYLPLLVDEFPYCDIKNTYEDLAFLTHNKGDITEEIMEHRSHIWKLTYNNCNYFVKQPYNRLNLQQLWNHFDSQKIHTIWMQYYTMTLSENYSCILQSIIKSEKLFTCILPACEIVQNEKIFKMYPELLEQLAKCEGKKQKLFISVDNMIQYFEKLNHSIQYKHKRYTICIYARELEDIFEKNIELFSKNEIDTIKNIFQQIKLHLLLDKPVTYGLNYGKSFLEHTVYLNEKVSLLPSSDIFIGELGQDEGILFAEYYLMYHSFIKTAFYPRKNVLIWTILYCTELFISNKILLKLNSIKLKDLINILNEINTEM